MTMTGARSLADLLLRRVAATPDRDAFLYPTDPGWGRYTWKDAGDRIRAIACGLRSLGLETEQRCAIIAATRIEWVLVDFGIMCAGGAVTTVYPSNTAEECEFILNDAHCVVAIVENATQLAKLEQRRAGLPNVRQVVLIDGAAPSNTWTMTLTQLMEAGRAWDAANPGAYEARIGELTPQHLATLIYTSGTTGRQKGVELIHDCWLYEAEAIEKLDLLVPDDVQFLVLPLSHSFGKVLECAQIHIGFISAVDGRFEKLVENLAEVKPTFMASPPRVYEKVHSKIVLNAQDAGGLKAKIFDWAFRVGLQVSRLRQDGRQPAGLLALQNAIADKLVFSKIQARFGGRLRFFISGAAALSREVAEFFHSADVLIAEGYGLTETSAASFVNRPGNFKFGTVGPPLPGTEVKTAPEDGEVLIRSRGVMRGYHNLPEATRETLDPDGWLHTGDIGVVDGDGFLKITDRKKDLIKTSGGKYVAPQTLEGKVKAACPYVNQVLVHGNNRNYCSALVTIDEESIRKWLRDNGGDGGATVEAMSRDPRVVALLQGYVDQVNATLASYETIKKFAILPADFTVDAGELTASLKIKRKVVEQKYTQVLEQFYEATTAHAAR